MSAIQLQQVQEFRLQFYSRLSAASRSCQYFIGQPDEVHSTDRRQVLDVFLDAPMIHFMPDKASSTFFFYFLVSFPGNTLLSVARFSFYV